MITRIDEDEEATEAPFDLAMSRRLLRFLGPQRRSVAIAVGAIVVGSACTLGFPLLTRAAIDDAILPGRPRVLFVVGALYLALALVRYVAFRLQTFHVAATGTGVIRDLRAQMFERISTLGFDFYDSRPMGKILTRVMNDVANLNQLLSSGILNSVGNVLTLLGTIVVMLALKPDLALLSFCVLPVMAVLTTNMRRRVVLKWRLLRRGTAIVNAVWNESLIGARVVTAFDRAALNEERFGALTEMVRRRYLQAMSLSARVDPVVDLTGTVGTALVYVYGAVLYIHGGVSLGLVVAFTSYLAGFWQPIVQLSGMANQVFMAMASAERVFEILDLEPSVRDRPDARPLPPIRGDVVLEGVEFAYVPGRPVLRDVNVHAPPGTTVAIVGPTGAGKSTFMGLLSRFYEPTAGRILVDGQDIAEVTLESLRRQIAVVLQDTFIFDATLRENIRYARPDASDAEVEAAARAAQAARFIEALPEGYDTPVRERGSRLSAGQRQLIAFARALLADPAVLILDEATASIDTETERLVQAALRRLLQNRTAFVVAHRLSTIREADVILVIEDGRIVERGRHDELVARPGPYRRLLEAQIGMESAGGLFRPAAAGAAPRDA
jgi:ATP-binding cassette subfamily B multidrug efflux pump